MNKHYNFYIVARDETHMWADGVLAKHDVRRAFGLYLICDGERTHVASLTASSWALFMGNEFIPEGDELTSDASELSGTPEDEAGTYFPLFDFVTIDKRFVAGPITVTLEDLDEVYTITEDTSDTELRELAWSYAEDRQQTNPIYPSITCVETYNIWEREEREARRALNIPPNHNPNPLPLFTHYS
jgi:hypothetical protein